MKSKQTFGKRGGNTIHADIRLRLEAYFLANIADKSNRIPNEEIYERLLEEQQLGLIMPEVNIPEVTTINNWMSRRNRAWKEDIFKKAKAGSVLQMDVDEESQDDNSDQGLENLTLDVQAENDVEELVSLNDSEDESGEEEIYNEDSSTDDE